MELTNIAKDLFASWLSLRKNFKSDKFLEELTFNEIRVCKLLVNEEMVQVKEISEVLSISRPALNAILNKLEDKELIERVRMKNDRKAVYIKLSDKTYDIYIQEKQRFVERMNGIVKSMGEEDTKLLIKLLNKLNFIINEEVK